MYYIIHIATVFQSIRVQPREIQELIWNGTMNDPWNGLDFTFPFLIERSTALGVEPSCILPRARFQPWKHLDLFAELAAYDPHRYMNLQSRLSLWGLSSNGHHLGDHDALTEQWRKGNPRPLEENLTFTLEAIQRT